MLEPLLEPSIAAVHLDVAVLQLLLVVDHPLLLTLPRAALLLKGVPLLLPALPLQGHLCPQPLQLPPQPRTATGLFAGLGTTLSRRGTPLAGLVASPTGGFPQPCHLLLEPAGFGTEEVSLALAPLQFVGADLQLQCLQPSSLLQPLRPPLACLQLRPRLPQLRPQPQQLGTPLRQLCLRLLQLLLKQ